MGVVKIISNFFAMYAEGIKNMTWGRQLWIIALVKLFIMFAILRVFFFPNILNSRCETKSEKSEYVSKELTKNHIY